MTPLRMALWLRDREGHPVTAGTLIHHSDAGSQYTSIRLTRHLDVHEIAASIGSVGDAFDNAMMESGNGLYKTEFATAAWVEWYNNRRLHSAIGDLSPVMFEHRYYTGLQRQGQPV